MIQEQNPSAQSRSKSAAKSGPRPVTYRHRDFFLKAAHNPGPNSYEVLQASPSGLTSDDIEERHITHGFNEIAHDRVRWQTQLRKALINPFNVLLGILAGVSYATQDFKGSFTLAAMQNAPPASEVCVLVVAE